MEEDRIYELVNELCMKRQADSKFVPGETVIKIGEATYDNEEINAMFKAILDGWFAMGKYGKEFESNLSNFIGQKYCALTNSGSSANLLAIESLIKTGKITDGDEVIVNPITFPTTFRPLVNNGIKPVFVDVDLKTLNFDEEKLKDSVGDKTKMILAQHTMGIPNNMKLIMDIAEEKNVVVMEDCCDALGSKYDGKNVGSFGDVSTFSFYVPHHITMGEGGALVTNELEIMKHARAMRDGGVWQWCDKCNDFVDTRSCTHKLLSIYEGMPEDTHRNFSFHTFGYKVRPMEFKAAMGLVQMRKLPDFTKRRKDNFEKLVNGISSLGDYFIFCSGPENSDVNWFGFPFIIKDGTPFSRLELIEWLEKHKIEPRPILAGNILKHKAAKEFENGFRVAVEMKNSDKILRDGLFLGVHPGIDDERINFIIDTFERFIKTRR